MTFSAVFNWILDKSKLAEAGDVINMYFQCHGNKTGGLVLGKKIIPVSQVVNLTRQFVAGVQVNVVGSHCRSGLLVKGIKADNQINRYAVGACGPEELTWTTPRSVSNRCRNFRFSQPFIQSLARVQLPGIDQTEFSPITLEQHENFMPEETKKFPIKRGLPQTYTSSIQLQTLQTAAMVLLEDLIFRDYTDIGYNREAIHRRRRAEWPILDLTLLNRLRNRNIEFSNVSSLAKTAAASLIKNASKVIDMESPYHCDGSVVELQVAMARPEEFHGEILRKMYYRGRQQSAVWDLFCILCDRGMLDMVTSLKEPINWCTSTQPVRAVYRILSCFDLVIRETEQDPPFEGWNVFDGPIEWLATVIARGCADPNLIITEIETTQILGYLHRDLFEEVKNNGELLSWTCDSKIEAGVASPYFAFWLPHGLGEDVEVYASKIRKKIGAFNRIEEVFKQYFEIPDYELQTEKAQDAYLREYPEREPRLKHSGHWKPEDTLVSPPLSPNNPQLGGFYQSLY